MSTRPNHMLEDIELADHRFPVRTPFGADGTTCPFCNGYTDRRLIRSFHVGKNGRDEDILEPCPGDGVYRANPRPRKCHASFCDECGVLYTMGCVHNERGCTDSDFHAKLLVGYTDPDTSQRIDRMPVFRNMDEVSSVCAKVELVLSCTCPAHLPKKRSTNI